MNSIPTLPPEIILYIAKDVKTYRLLLAIPAFARYTIESARPHILAKYTTITIDKYYKIYRIEGRKHREDGPAVEYFGGTKHWCINGKLHRDGDLPAIIKANGAQKWYQWGIRHRDSPHDDLPAIIKANGTQKWYQWGKLHRDSSHGDLPAIIKTNGAQKWYYEGELHRDDSPAIVKASGTQKWYQRGKLHCDDGPAVIHHTGAKFWYYMGILHREDGPAVEYPNESVAWINNGRAIVAPPYLDRA